MCRLASWQAETTGALGMLSVQEIWLILINTAPNPLSASCTTSAGQLYFPFSSCHMRFCCPPRVGSPSPSSCSIRLDFCNLSEVEPAAESEQNHRPGHHQEFFSRLNSLKPSPTAPPLHPPPPPAVLPPTQFADDTTLKVFVTEGDESARRGEVAFYTKTTSTSEIVVGDQKYKSDPAPLIMSGSPFRFLETVVQTSPQISGLTGHVPLLCLGRVYAGVGNPPA